MDAVARELHVVPHEHFVHDVPGTYPRLCRLADGSIIAGFTTIEPDGQRVLSIARSVDNARTFHPHGEVTRSRGDCDNLSLLQLPPLHVQTDEAGPVNTVHRILAAFRNHDLDEQGNPTWFRITVCQSTDGGRSWSFLSQAFEKPAPFGLWEPFLRLGQGGRDGDGTVVELYFSQEMDAEDQDTMVVRSFDLGRTWSVPRPVTGQGERLRDGMVGLAEVECAPGLTATVMVLETNRLGTTFSIEALVSPDYGETFTQRQLVYEPRVGRNAGAPQIAALDGGYVVVVFMTDEDEPGESRWPEGAKIKAVYGRLLEDGSLVLSKPVVVGESAAFWPGIMALSGSTALAVFESSPMTIKGHLLMTPNAQND